MRALSGKAATREKRGQQLKKSHAWSFACLRHFARWTKKKERLLVVYFDYSKCENIKIMILPSTEFQVSKP